MMTNFRQLETVCLTALFAMGIAGCGKNEKSPDKSLDEATPTKTEKKSADVVNYRKNLSEVGIALHYYHDKYKHFPTASSSGDVDAATGKPLHTGLSWRVHILPLLQQEPLYQQFKLNEPWDSPHNRKLISRMPDVFKSPGVGEPEKTTMHVFVGQGAPFGGKAGTAFRMITDGTSGTLMVVVAGPNKAEIWTKPGGLEFNAKKDPLPLLGKIPNSGFLAVMMDGRVRRLGKSITGDQLKRLVQHADGQPVVDIPGLYDKQSKRNHDTPKKVDTRRQLRNNLRRVALAMINYATGHRDRLPSPASELSWRVHILPGLDNVALYRQFRFDEPWFSPHNKKLIAHMPAIFKTPGVKDPTKTSMHVFVGPGTLFHGNEGTSFDEVAAKDGQANTILAVIAGADKAEVWTKPGGLPFDPKKNPLTLLGKIPDSGIPTVMMDGRMIWIAKSIKPEQLKRLIQYADGQPVGKIPTTGRPK
jgi:Protein of unknown function (DUF1559)